MQRSRERNNCKVAGSFLVGFTFLMSGALISEPQRAAVIGHVEVWPGPNFDFKSNQIIGKGKKEGKNFSAKLIQIPIESFVTGISLRDQHLKQHLAGPAKSKYVEAKDIKASDGKGSATLVVRGVSKVIHYSYKDLGKNLAEANLELKMSDFGINDVNYKGAGAQDEVKVSVWIPYEGR